jgi:tRNA (cytosine38-C5)-methyltransferase
MRSLGYTIAEFLLTPLQFGIPNSRLRYYLLAKRSLSFRSLQNGNDQTLRYIPGRGHEPWVDPRLDDLNSDHGVHQISEYLDPEPVEGYGIPDKVLEKWGRLFDIVLPSSRRTCCFTRGAISPHLSLQSGERSSGYTQLVERSGSILQMNEDQDVFPVHLRSYFSTNMC